MLLSSLPPSLPPYLPIQIPTQHQPWADAVLVLYSVLAGLHLLEKGSHLGREGWREGPRGKSSWADAVLFLHFRIGGPPSLGEG